MEWRDHRTKLMWHPRVRWTLEGLPSQRSCKSTCIYMLWSPSGCISLAAHPSPSVPPSRPAPSGVGGPPLPSRPLPVCHAIRHRNRDPVAGDSPAQAPTRRKHQISAVDVAVSRWHGQPGSVALPEPNSSLTLSVPPIASRSLRPVHSVDESAHAPAIGCLRLVHDRPSLARPPQNLPPPARRAAPHTDVHR
jgi:hypothetical protein